MSTERRQQRLLDELLSDPLIQMVMTADRVDPRALRDLLDKAVSGCQAHGPGSPEMAGVDVSLSADHSTGYRPGVGIALFNVRGEVFVGQRIVPGERGWQMPQGGIEPGEAPREAALRELREEIGTDNVEILAESRGWLRYDVAAPLLGVAWDGRWRGQEQKWFAMRFLGTDGDINLATAHPEFSALGVGTRGVGPGTDRALQASALP